jgi:hypothetical protein
VETSLTEPQNTRIRSLIGLLFLGMLLFGCAQPNVPKYSNNTVDPYMAKRWSAPQFTTAHSSLNEAVRHFLNIKTTPQQPIDFPHKIHTADIGVGCTDCHLGAEKGARAGIPSVNICMSCHEDLGDPKDSRIQTLRAYAKRGEDIPWQRVYGFNQEAHVRFNHAPHIRAKVDCATCHGDLTQMTVAQRVVDHSMNFCISCHKQKAASNDCLTCHY